MPQVGHLGRALLLAAFALAGLFAAPALSQTVDSLELKQNESVEKYRQLSQQIALSEKRQAEIAAEIAAIKDDSAALTTALIQAVKTERKLGEDVAEIQGRLRDLGAQEQEIRVSLASRRGTLAEVLGALQRMGLNPPPALLVRPEDALASVRSAILLGAVVPELRSETELLVADLDALTRVKTSITAEQERLQAKRTEHAEEKERLTLLLAEKGRMQANAEAQMKAEREQASALADRATSLQELISSLEKEIESLRRILEAKRQTGENLLSEALPFAERAGLVPLPVSGEFAKHFGEDDGTGGSLKGDILRTQSGAIVTAPVDGMVLYAGPFRSYGQLLILNPGDGYHIVLAGMDRLNVSLGQSVLAGEPVGMMGEARLASIAASTLDGAVPELYVEFRKDGKPIDPKLWWARELSGRTGNDS
ncbi:peptidoglycan DD-metalloendopeptidase family protein [Chelativorans sp. AA-79]|uniref:murein hydrolase activator EnvC family protein n=1 Tax=Chelativorans sp. AA-79 TaxID=3028735 RepID=UPI0023FA2D34|nr:peptidoglycan DD-metalloendopeptidase family protein [Chelativorans sp. AA-79]WEX09782.1 peptidoglycan DD-metalloendopeptidase family protein [Chelativorans sp. AA-79]